ncbi:hypothetical protein QBC40DRAFT_156290, partial [Triangularia verruculosa]
TTTTANQRPPPPSPPPLYTPSSYLLPIPAPTIILKSYSDFEPWFQTLLAVANILSLVPLFHDLQNYFRQPLSVLQRDTPAFADANSLRVFQTAVPNLPSLDGILFIFDKPEYPVLWERFPRLFVHRLSLEEQKSVIFKVFPRGTVHQGNGNVWWGGYDIVFGGPNRAKEERLGVERMTGMERRRWRGVLEVYEEELRRYEGQVWALGQMRGWLGGAVDKGLMGRVMDPDKGEVWKVWSRSGRTRRRDDDVGEWGGAGGLRKLVFGCLRVLAGDEEER